MFFRRWRETARKIHDDLVSDSINRWHLARDYHGNALHLGSQVSLLCGADGFSEEVWRHWFELDTTCCNQFFIRRFRGTDTGYEALLADCNHQEKTWVLTDHIWLTYPPDMARLWPKDFLERDSSRRFT